MNWHGLRRALVEIHPADLAEQIEQFEGAEEAILFRLLGRRKGEVFAHLSPGRQRRIIRTTEPAQLSRILSQMSPDDRTRVLEQLPSTTAHALLGHRPPFEMPAPTLPSVNSPEYDTDVLPAHLCAHNPPTLGVNERHHADCNALGRWARTPAPSTIRGFKQAE